MASQNIEKQLIDILQENEIDEFLSKKEQEKVIYSAEEIKESIISQLMRNRRILRNKDDILLILLDTLETFKNALKNSEDSLKKSNLEEMTKIQLEINIKNLNIIIPFFRKVVENQALKTERVTSLHAEKVSTLEEPVISSIINTKIHLLPEWIQQKLDNLGSSRISLVGSAGSDPENVAPRIKENLQVLFFESLKRTNNDILLSVFFVMIAYKKQLQEIEKLTKKTRAEEAMLKSRKSIIEDTIMPFLRGMAEEQIRLLSTDKVNENHIKAVLDLGDQFLVEKISNKKPDVFEKFKSKKEAPEKIFKERDDKIKDFLEKGYSSGFFKRYRDSFKTLSGRLYKKYNETLHQRLQKHGGSSIFAILDLMCDPTITLSETEREFFTNIVNEEIRVLPENILMRDYAEKAFELGDESILKSIKKKDPNLFDLEPGGGWKVFGLLLGLITGPLSGFAIPFLATFNKVRGDSELLSGRSVGAVFVVIVSSPFLLIASVFTSLAGLIEGPRHGWNTGSAIETVKLVYECSTLVEGTLGEYDRYYQMVKERMTVMNASETSASNPFSIQGVTPELEGSFLRDERNLSLNSNAPIPLVTFDHSHQRAGSSKVVVEDPSIGSPRENVLDDDEPEPLDAGFRDDPNHEPRF